MTLQQYANKLHYYLLIGLALASKDSTMLALAEQYLSYEPYGLMLRRGDPDFRLAVNRVLSRLYRSGQIYPIYERWFGAVYRASPLLQTMYLLHGLPESLLWMARGL
jgi:glutamate/aspartate transport system substrate-binding protein